MRAAELIRLLEQLDPDTEVPVAFSDSRNLSAVPEITACSDSDRHRCYEQLVERAEDGMLVVDVSGRITYMNPYLVRLSGYRATDLAGRPLQQLLAETDADYLQQRLCHDQPGSRRRFTLRLRTADGQWRWVRMTVTPVPSAPGQFRGCMMTVTDLSQLQSLQAAGQTLGDKVDWVHAQLEQLKLRRGHLHAEQQQMHDLPRIHATPFWHQGRYLYLNQPQINGKRTRRYIGSQPDKVRDALAAVRRAERYQQIEQELQQLDAQIRSASFRLDGFLWELGQLPPVPPRLLTASA